MNNINTLMTTNQNFLTDGGFETCMFFHEGFSAPEFAAIVLMDNADFRLAMRRYFDRFLQMAADTGTGFVLDTNTWRGCTGWGPKLNLSMDKMLGLSRAAVEFAEEIRTDWRSRVSPILVNGVVGPAGDGYAPDKVLTVAEASELHRPQIKTFAECGVDMISAITMTSVAEAAGITRTANEENISAVVISFTVETDGRLPSGETLGDAISMVDEATQKQPLYYMVNCAHPDHFSDTLKSGSEWTSRIGGVRANTSRLSHAELDEAEVLDEGDPTVFGELHKDLIQLLPNLRVFGGCCGTDHRHVGCVSSYIGANAN